VYTAINDRSSIQYGRRTQQNAILLKRDQIQDFVDNTARELEAGTFRAEKYTDSKGSRKFTLLPIFSMQAGHVQLDLETLPPILRRAGLITRRTLSEEEFLRVVWQNFDFTHIGLERVEDLFIQDIKWR
jgi:hypothetical protein